MVLQYEPSDILRVLNILIKNAEIPKNIETFIIEYTSRYGSAKMFLKSD